MADWFIATEGVKVVKDSASLWPQIVTAISSAGAAWWVLLSHTVLPAGVKKLLLHVNVTMNCTLYLPS